MSHMVSDLPTRMKELRKLKKVTRPQLAAGINRDESTVKHYEYGETRPSVEALIAIADYFDVSIDYLVGRHTVRPKDVKVEVHKLLKCMIGRNESMLQAHRTIKAESYQRMVDAKKRDGLAGTSAASSKLESSEIASTSSHGTNTSSRRTIWKESK